MNPRQLLEISKSYTSQKSGVYMIYCILDEIAYIGSSVKLKARLQRHLNMLKKNEHCNQHLQNAWNKYGHSMFTIVILEEVDLSNEALLERENFYILRCDKELLFNKTIPAVIGREHGFKHSKESCEKMSKSRIGNKCRLGYVYSEEEKKKLSESNKGKKRSEETKKRMSIARTGYSINAGENHPQGKIDKETALKIFEEYQSIKRPGLRARGAYTLLAKKYNTTKYIVASICIKRHWSTRVV